MSESSNGNGRILREQTFHDNAYGSQVRSGLSFMYPELTSIRKEYENAILLNCSGKKVLEYGCGLGSYAHSLAEKNADVFGIDISEFAIKAAREGAKKRGVSIDFRVMNAERLEFAAETFDIICGTSILHHLDLALSVAEIRRVLKPGGRAVFIEPLGHNPLINLFRLITPAMRSHDEHPLKVKDLQRLSKQFQSVVIHHYFLISLVAFPFHKRKFYNKLGYLLESIDKVVFRLFPPAKKYSWQIIINIIK